MVHTTIKEIAALRATPVWYTQGVKSFGCFLHLLFNHVVALREILVLLA